VRITWFIKKLLTFRHNNEDLSTWIQLIKKALELRDFTPTHEFANFTFMSNHALKYKRLICTCIKAIFRYMKKILLVLTLIFLSKGMCLQTKNRQTIRCTIGSSVNSNSLSRGRFFDVFRKFPHTAKKSSGTEKHIYSKQKRRITGRIRYTVQHGVLLPVTLNNFI
jgi:hypothetical protein